ncbi:2-isopropylmalate synthase [Clostridia bacterium]|nr:2-isopropylmalate synthase [Clostridia bacterium]
MRRVKIFDTTLRDGEQAPGFSMSLYEKTELAVQLERLKVDVIEAGFAASSHGDAMAVKAVAQKIKDCAVASLCRAVERDIDLAWNALASAAAPRIHIVIATSALHMERKLKMQPEQVIERVRTSVKYAAKLCGDVQFSAEDACRSDPEFLAEVCLAAVNAGATTINIPDTVGYILPSEFQQLVSQLVERINDPNITFAVHCHNDLGMATANSLAGILGGAGQVECTISGIGERGGNAALEEIAMALYTRSQAFNAFCNIETRQIYRTNRLLQTVTGVVTPPHKPIVGQNAFAHEAGIHQHGVMAARETYEIMNPADVGIPQISMVLGKHSGRHAFEERMKFLGLELSGEQLEEAFERFKTLADRKKTISDRDLQALVAHSPTDHPGLYNLDGFVINSGTSIDSTCILTLKTEDEKLTHVSFGDGPIDAAFTAINTLVGCNFTLDAFTLSSVTEGEDALGEAVVRLSYDGRSAAGRGLSTDIVEASIKAYLNGVNKFLADS